MKELVVGVIAIIAGLIIGILIKKKEINKLQNTINAKVDERVAARHDRIQAETDKILAQAQEKLDTINAQITNGYNVLASQKATINSACEDYREKQMTLIQRDIDDWAKSAQECAEIVAEENNNDLTNQTNILRQQQLDLQNNLLQLQSQQADLLTTIQVINNDIRTNRMEAEAANFYRIQISDEARADLEILKDTKAKIHLTEMLNKLVYDNYIRKPVSEMVKRVLCNRDPSGIYKVTNILTHEAYIGKSVNIATRWQNHIKSAYGLEGVADSQFQRALKKYGIDNFIWELLVEVPKDKLTEEEKKYITLYDTTHTGYNERIG